MIADSPGLAVHNRRIDSWKLIAHYMGRSSRTVQRWHSAFGLPIRHLAGESSSVFAFSDELDDWLRKRNPSWTLKFVNASGTEAPLSDSSPPALRQSDLVFDSSLVSPQVRSRSAQLVLMAHRIWEGLSARNLTSIVQCYREASDLNPGNAAAYAGLALGLTLQGVWGTGNPASAYAAARIALKNAADFDSEMPFANAADALLMMLLTRDWEGARRGFDEILRRSPECLHSLDGRGLLYLAEGSLEEASAMFLAAAGLGPLSSISMALYCWSQYLEGEFAHALDRIDDLRASGHEDPIIDAVEAFVAIRLPDPAGRIERLQELAAGCHANEVPRGALGYAYALRGEPQKARELLHGMMRKARAGMAHAPYAAALILIGLDESKQAVQWLEQSYRNGSLWSLGFRSDPILEPLRANPHFRRFLGKASYPHAASADHRFDAAG